ncbi:lipopolysaccharide kinase InaA family protein [Porphyromonas loveana]|uniref:lipopolysaccharide kinase InaA family protein n=1 Tax=Porphyromonas loveana TaxID=1884669 RepID=UPI00359FD86D
MLRHYTDHPNDLPLLQQTIAATQREESGAPAGDTPRSRILYAARNKLYTVSSSRGNLVVKSFRIPIILQRIVYTFLRPSKALRSYRNAIRLQSCGIGTPTPLGYAIERKDGLLRRSYYVCESIATGRDIRLAMQGLEEDDTLLRALAAFIARMHQAGIHHIDLSPGNVLYEQNDEGEYRFYLIDLNRMRFYDCPITGQRAYDNFARLSLCSAVSQQLAEYYAEVQGTDISEAVRGIQTASDRFFRSKVRKYACKTLVKEEKSMSRSAHRRGYLRYRRTRLLRKITHSAALYRREEELYHTYLEAGDLRGTLRRSEGYTQAHNEK